jgi:hypothetical protein
VKKIDLDNSMNYYKSHLGSFLDIINQNLSVLRYAHRHHRTNIWPSKLFLG